MRNRAETSVMQGPKPAEVPVENCGRCHFAGEREGYENYPCRRHAPLAVHDASRNSGVHLNAFVPRWPLMKRSDWCGDFVAR